MVKKCYICEIFFLLQTYPLKSVTMGHIDLRKIIASKSQKLAKYIPNFVYNWLDGLLHVEELNDILEKGWELTPKEFLVAFFKRQNITYSASGLDSLDPSGRYMFASNHPFGGMDGMMVADLLIAHFGDARVVVNDILMNLKPLAPLWIPVNTLGKQNSEYAKKFDAELSGDNPIMTFPAGLCSRYIDGTVQDPKWKNTFIRRAHATSRSVVPIYVDGTLHKGFYRLYRMRKALGIKANLEMLLLVDGMFRQSGSHIKILVGAPMTLDELASYGDPTAQCEEVRRRVYELKSRV